MQTTLQSIFKNYTTKRSIFKNKKAITISYSPFELPHREKEIETIASILAPSLRGEKPSNIFIYGKPGTGKTAVISFVTKNLQEIKKDGIRVIYINCKMRKIADTEYRLIAHLAREFGENVPVTGLPTDHIYNLFFKALDEKEEIVILVLDEIDAIVSKIGDGFLYNLTRINQELKNSQLSIIGISNNLSFTNNIDPRVKSSLSEEEIIFHPYNAVQLQNILRSRSKIAFNDGVIEEGVIEKCAALAAQEHGDARRALDLLRVAAEIAERENSEKVEERHVDIAESKIDNDRILEAIRSQPRQSQAVLWSILKLNGDGAYTGDVYDVYTKVCVENGIKPLTQRRVSDLISELDLLGIINARVVSKGRYGRTRIIKMNLYDSLINKIKDILITQYYFQ
ncbi:MAG: ORC1-type DNA replication protein [Candidatus Aenigmarchaeota archaeon]|nr:ORC1-type DNA replication protein [Candidatus Aenigmarchaeota archaeon]